VVARLGSSHVLEFSMHAMLRPHYVLHTREFRPQTEDLDLSDWMAIEAVMRAVEAVKGSSSSSSGRSACIAATGKGWENGVVVTAAAGGGANGVKPVNSSGRTTAANDSNKGVMMIYNCGYDGGASQGHKHVQVFQEREVGEIASLFPSRAESMDGECAMKRERLARLVLFRGC